MRFLLGLALFQEEPAKELQVLSGSVSGNEIHFEASGDSLSTLESSEGLSLLSLRDRPGLLYRIESCVFIKACVRF